MEEGSTFYIDTNVLVYAFINSERLGELCRSIIRDMHIGKIIGLTSCLAFDEFLWSVKKIKPDLFIDMGKDLLNLNIKFIDVNKIILHHALDIILNYKLKPRDAIHAATMELNNIKNLISEDSDFDKIGWIKRKSIMNFKI